MTEDPSKPLSLAPAVRDARRRRWILLLVLVVALAGAAAWLALRKPAEKGGAGGASGTTAPSAEASAGSASARRGGRGPGPDAAPAVAVAAARVQDIRVTQNALGTVTPLETVTVQAQVGGQLTQVAFVEGQSVRKGDFLALIDPRPFEAALAQAKGQLAKDQAALEEARMDYARYQDLVQKKSIMRQQAEDQKWIVAQDEGAVQVDQAQVETAAINLGYCRIVSPTDGRIGLRLVDPGNVVQAGTTSANLAVITRMQPMTVVFALPEDSLPAVLARQRAGARLPVQAYDRSGTRLLDTGVLSAIDSQINTSTGTVNLKALFANKDGALFPNQFVNVVLRVDEIAGATAMPTAAVQRGTGGTYTYVLRADNTVAMTPVKLGPVDAGLVAVLSGVKAGDRVVVDGADKLRDGMSVVVGQGGS